MQEKKFIVVNVPVWKVNELRWRTVAFREELGEVGGGVASEENVTGL
jgi:hypothetical protein